ncbi:alanine--tRNA ligase [Alteromonas sp. ASW11-36]|uniref:Alanine--tRNA ligase n=1 Tax=Alteromonas arenosi TaxID=3055817 RepID=A0ABT7SV73_9ALTE|nr:alanine--tRNA ligase [Alteromonas sp. ASW11-36]MDM7860093.1 alanine--tRNA ligase [Alteromonas sp. ASW11-36]
MTLSTAQIRSAFIDFFAKQGHQAVPSSSLIPHDDPTLLFTNAGMNQFKDVFLGAEKRAYTRAVSSQRCVRAGGKHNDLDNVGYTARHHTFFEMLGNFSFGDYFKTEAIQFAWQFLTEELKLPKEKLLVTVYSEDDEAYGIWKDTIGIPEEKIIRISTSDNFWSMGDTGPCGPCSEIFYDHGEHIWGGPPGSPEEDGDRFIEIWNLVFMQFNRQADGTMEPLPKPSIDTGMGLERISAIMQNVHSNYEIDLFQALIKAAAEIVGTADIENKSLRVIADHIRSCAFLICDGAMPSNEGRGYVLRRIIRRAVRHGYKLGASDIFFYRLVQALCDQMSDAYPELKEQQAVIEKVLRVEEEQFSRTLERGMSLLNQALGDMEGDIVPGELVFKLYDTYGFPADLTADVAREKGFAIDEEGFAANMQKQRERAQQSSQFGADYANVVSVDHITQFTGYEKVEQTSEVVAIVVDGQKVDAANDVEEALVFLAETPFYAESGGQVGDTGMLIAGTNIVTVKDTVKVGNAFAHKGSITGQISVGDQVSAVIDSQARNDIALNHSATHLLHAALRQLLGEHVTQKGSLVDKDKLRFDFSHLEAVTDQQLLDIEQLVNAQIRANNPLTTELMAIDAAKDAGAMALFGEKYDDEVRVVRMGDFSIELCGGTHVKSTGDIGLFKIVSEGGIASGVRRIEAITGAAALEYVQLQQGRIAQAAQLVKADPNALVERIKGLLQLSKDLEKQNQQLTQKLNAQKGADVLSSAVEIKGVKVLVTEMPGVESKALRPMMDDLKNQIGSGVICIGTSSGDKVSIISGVTKDLTGKIKAGELVNYVAAQVGGKGGGRPDMAQAGGSQPENLAKALSSVNTYLEDKL